jgi:hypothetical protein
MSDEVRRQAVILANCKKVLLDYIASDYESDKQPEL